MNKALALAAAAEIATGTALVIVPSLVGRLLLGEALSGVAVPVARVLGIGLIALGIACCPSRAHTGMLTYSAAVTLYLAFLGIRGEWAGPLLWPAALLHMLLTLLLVRTEVSAANSESSL